MGGFCAISKTLPLPQSVETETVIPEVAGNGMNAAYGESVHQNIHCVAAEPHATIVRVSVTDGGQEVAYETAVLGRLRGGYRVLQMRSVLGTRIELCYLFIKISFGSEPNLWATPRQLRMQHLMAESKLNEAIAQQVKPHLDQAARLKRKMKKLKESKAKAEAEVVELKEKTELAERERSTSPPLRCTASVTTMHRVHCAAAKAAATAAVATPTAAITTSKVVDVRERCMQLKQRCARMSPQHSPQRCATAAVRDAGLPVDDPGVPVDDPGLPVDDQGLPVDDPGLPVDAPPIPEATGSPGLRLEPLVGGVGKLLTTLRLQPSLPALPSPKSPPVRPPRVVRPEPRRIDADTRIAGYFRERERPRQGTAAQSLPPTN